MKRRSDLYKFRFRKRQSRWVKTSKEIRQSFQEISLLRAHLCSVFPPRGQTRSDAALLRSQSKFGDNHLQRIDVAQNPSDKSNTSCVGLCLLRGSGAEERQERGGAPSRCLSRRSVRIRKSTGERRGAGGERERHGHSAEGPRGWRSVKRRRGRFYAFGDAPLRK